MSAGQPITTIDEMTLREALHFAALVENGWNIRLELEIRAFTRRR